eukprot:COSAG06_NODE_23210_length_699_cov_1.500000_1_plen_153_part_10
MAQESAGSAAEDKVALQTFRAAGDPDEPCGEGWDSDSSGWAGVQCDAEGGRVTRIHFHDKDGLLGTLESLAPLTALNYLYLYSCDAVSGDVGSLAALTQLTSLRLYLTSVSGSVEPLAALTQLTILELSSTSVSGSVEPLAALTQLTSLRLYS